MGTQYSVLTASMRRYLPVFAVAVAGMVALALTPDLVVAQQAIAQARTTISNIIGLAGPEGMGAISLEPGGQFELSGAPLENLHDTCILRRMSASEEKSRFTWIVQVRYIISSPLLPTFGM